MTKAKKTAKIGFLITDNALKVSKSSNNNLYAPPYQYILSPDIFHIVKYCQKKKKQCIVNCHDAKHYYPDLQGYNVF